MMKRRSKRATGTEPVKDTPPVPSTPDVILDFIFEEGLFFVEIRNIGIGAAVNVKTKFSKRFTGLGGECEMPRLSMFRNIAFLAPGRSVRTFLDSSDSYFRRKQPTQIDATLSWLDMNGKRFNVTIHHDLAIYADIIILHRNPKTSISKE
ncbi:MAG: hypothetical protein KF749_07265 [Bacteroidetes bacterium]|nr:hypothetical protein [Bacteroidota bacterium]MCW5896571.1 hypothetical protein [Bacteroidota bacterium]